MDGEVYCNWIGMSVHENKLGKSCKNYIVDGKCNKCARSEQLALGMPVEDLLRNLKSCA